MNKLLLLLVSVSVMMGCASFNATKDRFDDSRKERLIQKEVNSLLKALDVKRDGFQDDGSFVQCQKIDSLQVNYNLSVMSCLMSSVAASDLISKGRVPTHFYPKQNWPRGNCHTTRGDDFICSRVSAE